MSLFCRAALSSGCCELVLQSSTEQCVGHFAKTSAAVHWWWVTAHLYEQHNFVGVIALTQGCEPVLQSSTEHWGLHFAKISDAAHWWWVTAHLCEQQIFKGVIAVTQRCCEPGVEEQH